MLKKLNGWNRIGVVVSVCWLLYALLLGVNNYLRVGDEDGRFVVSMPAGRYCTKLAPAPPPSERKYTEEEIYGCAPGALLPPGPPPFQFLWLKFFNFLLTPIFLGWLSAYSILWVIRWISDGFRARRA